MMFFTLALASLPTIAPPAPQESPADERPPFAFLRQNEDWSRFRAAAEPEDFFDPIKHIALSDDGRVWLSLGGRVEARLERWDNFGFAAANDDTFVVSRALAHADLHVGDMYRVFVEGKTAQATDRDLPGGRRTLDLDTLALQQAFVDVVLPVGDGTLRLRPGRQMLLFGAQRLVSPLPWGNTLRTWDGVTAEWRTGPWSVTALATHFAPVDKTSFNSADDDVTLWGAYATRAGSDGGPSFDLFALGNERPDVTVNGTTGNEQRLTLGARAHGPAPGRLDYDAEVAWQVGEIGAEDVEAWSVATQLGWRPEGCPGAPRLWIGLDAASGDDEPGGDVGTFHQLFPLGHAYFGHADAVGRQNILDLSLGSKWTVTPRVNLSLALHSFRALENDDALYNAGGSATRSGFESRDIGREVDLAIDVRLDRHAHLHAGYAHFFAGDAIEETGPSEDLDFVHIGVRYTF